MRIVRFWVREKLHYDVKIPQGWNCRCLLNLPTYHMQWKVSTTNKKRQIKLQYDLQFLLRCVCSNHSNTVIVGLHLPVEYQ
jgi:hypothetical protein